MCVAHIQTARMGYSRAIDNSKIGKSSLPMHHHAYYIVSGITCRSQQQVWWGETLLLSLDAASQGSGMECLPQLMVACSKKSIFIIMHTAAICELQWNYSKLSLVNNNCHNKDGNNTNDNQNDACNIETNIIIIITSAHTANEANFYPNWCVWRRIVSYRKVSVYTLYTHQAKKITKLEVPMQKIEFDPFECM